MLTSSELWHAGARALDAGLAQWSGAQGLAARQQRRLAALMRAAEGSALYRERFERHGAGFDSQPPLSRRELMARFDDSLTDRSLTLAGLQAFMRAPERIGQPVDGRHTVWQSSGSTGEAGVFVQDEAAMSVYEALEAVRRVPSARRWMDPALLTERIAFVGATDGHFASIAAVQRLRHRIPGMTRRLQGFSFLQPRQQLMAALNAWRPTIVATYPTAALMLAEAAQRGELRLELSELWTGGEALTEGMRDVIARAFGCPVWASYGASEFLALACECAHRRLHFNGDWAILEPVDRHGRPVPDGTPCHTTWLTNLANHAQPLIRYDLGDRVRFAGHACACGSPLPVIEVEGRIDDSLCVTGAHGHAIRLPPLALTTVIEDDAGWSDFQLVQHGPRLLELTLGGAASAATTRRSRKALAAYLRSQGAGEVRLAVHCGEPSMIGHSGKRPRVVARAAGHAACP